MNERLNNLIVIDFGFGGVELMTDEQVEQMKQDMGEAAWNDYGPYVCHSLKEAVQLIADHIECETTSENPDIDAIDVLNDLLKDIAVLM